MFLKKMMAVATASVFLLGTLPVEAGTFGKSSSSSSSGSRSSSFSGSSSRSSSFNSPSRSSSATNSASSSTNRSGSISNGNSIGMSRSSVANNVKSGNYTPPANGTTVAGSNPGGSNYNNSSNYNNNRSNNGGYANNGGYNNGYNNGNNGYQQPNQGHSTGTVVGAAAAGALAGYALGNHNNHGNTTVVMPNGGGYNNGNGTAYNNGATNNGNGTPMVDSNGNYVNSPANVMPNNANYNSNSSGGFGSFIWTLLKIVIGLAILFFIVRFLMGLFNRNSSNNAGSSFSPSPSPVFNTKTPEDEIRDIKEDFFVQFQQNNRPSGMDAIRQQSTPVFFNAVEDFVRDQDENRTVKVRQIDAQLVDLVQEGSRYVASVRYHAVVAEGTPGNMNDNEVKELWNFVYENNRWKLAGIDQL